MAIEQIQTKQSTNYRIKLTVAVYKNRKLVYRNDMLVPTLYKRRSECRIHIRKETQHRLRNSNFFLSPRIDFDLVRYAQEASSNTYLRYRVIEEKTQEKDLNPSPSSPSSSLAPNKKHSLLYDAFASLQTKKDEALLEKPESPLSELYGLSAEEDAGLEQAPETKEENEDLQLS